MNRPVERASLRTVWLLLGFGLLAGVGGHFAGTGGGSLIGEILGGAAVFLTVLAVLALVALLVFRVLLPALGLVPPRIAHDLTMTFAAAVWALVWLRLSGVDPSQLVTTSALLTAVVAFSMQDTLGNVLGGVALQLDSSLRVGDWVRIDDVSGRVVDVRWRYTAIELRNRERLVVPNGWLMRNRFAVVRAVAGEPLLLRRTVLFCAEDSAPPGRVLEALEASVRDADIDWVAKEPPPSAVLLEPGFGFNRFALRYFLTDPGHDDPADSAVRVHALAALERAGIRHGIPQEEHLVVKENEAWRLATTAHETSRRLEAIRSSGLFTALPEAEQVVLAGHLVYAPFAKGDVLTRQGAVAHWLYLLVSGEVEVFVESEGGRASVSRLRGGDYFGEMGMLTGEPRTATVVALTDVACYRLDKEGFRHVLEVRPELAREMSDVLARRRAETAARLGALPTEEAPLRGDLLRRILRFFSEGKDAALPTATPRGHGSAPLRSA